MTTASIYYHPASSEPDFVVIDGESTHVFAADYTGARNIVGGRIRAVDFACRRLGWKVVEAAAIVRQTDGRATIRIEPVSPNPDDAGGGSINIGDSGIPISVAVGDKAEPVHTMCSLTSALPGNATRAAQAVHVAFAVLEHSPVGPLPTTPGTHFVPVVADADLPDMTVGLPTNTDDWRDVPTMVRIDDDTARLLNLTAERLGLPADVLAATYIRRGAHDAQERQAREQGNIADHSRITGWSADGTAHLKGE